MRQPTAVAELRAGERVLDLGSGSGIDVLLSAQRAGPTDKAHGLDMTDEMLALALANTAKADVTNVEFLKGAIETILLPSRTTDVVISNCVINLSVDKLAVFAEPYRSSLPAAGSVSPTWVADDQFSRAQQPNAATTWALTFAEYHAGLAAAGFADIQITPTHAVADGSTRR